MKIGIDIRNIGKKRTGDEAVFLNLVKNLAEIDKQNDYKLFTDIMDKNKIEEIKKSLGIYGRNNFEVLSLTRPAGTLSRGERGIMKKLLNNKFSWNFWTLPKYLRKNPTDVYLTQYITPWFVSRRVKIITIIHDISFNFFPQLIKKADLFFLKTLIPMSLKRADKILAVSKFTREEIIKYYKINPEKVEWIHNAVADDFLEQDISPQKLESVRKKYNLPEKFILYLGTLQPRKNIPALIEAYAICHSKLVEESRFNNPKILLSPKRNQDDGFKLVIAGGRGHNYDKKIDEAVEKYNLENSVVFTGFVDEEDKAALIKGAGVFVFPSFYEGFGIPILEAMSVGTPVIASDIAPHREIAGEAANFFDPKNPEDLSQKLLELINDKNLRGNLTQKGREQVKKFSWKETAEKILGIFQKIV